LTFNLQSPTTESHLLKPLLADAKTDEDHLCAFSRLLYNRRRLARRAMDGIGVTSFERESSS
jgi:hypothetical protein